MEQFINDLETRTDDDVTLKIAGSWSIRKLWESSF